MATETLTIPAPTAMAGDDILVTQLFIFGVVFCAFWVGVWARGALDDDLPSMTFKQMAATALLGFIVLAYPLAHLVQEAWNQPDASRDIDALMAACIPILVTGVSAREQLLRWFCARDTANASDAAS